MEPNKVNQLKNPTSIENSEKEQGTLAIDLGSSNTVVVFQKENGEPPKLLDLPPITKRSGEIPSLIWQSSNKKDDDA